MAALISSPIAPECSISRSAERRNERSSRFIFIAGGRVLVRRPDVADEDGPQGGQERLHPVRGAWAAPSSGRSWTPTPHTMRRTAITRLVKAGVDLPAIQRISGHKTLAMVLRYVNVHGHHIDAAISALDGRFSDTVTPELHMPAIPEQPEVGRVVAISSGKSGA
ncbi:MAG: site-specific integrase [Alphaproteobacteria bacterium]|nr:site-specific integrase [Alphaproteobacteria bacterium]